MLCILAGLRPLAVALVGAATLGHGHASQAQSTAPASTLDAILVTGTRDRSLTVPTLDEAEREIRGVPGGAEIVDPRTYENGRAATLTDMLRFAPGVFVQPRFGAQEARISIRGSGVQRTFHGRGIVVLQDGVPVNLADGSFDMQSIEPLGLLYTEVFRGANALQYGATTLGGAINFVAPTGYSVDPVRLRGEGGSFGYYQLFAQGGGVSGDWDFAGSASYQAQDGYREWSEQKNARFFGNAGFRINPDLETRFYLSAVDTDSQLPGSLTKAQAENDPRMANPGNLAGRQKRDYPLYRIANKTAYRVGAGLLEAAAFYSYKDLSHPIFQVIDQVSNDYGVSLRYVTDATLAGGRNRIVVGFVPQWGTVEDNRFVNVGGQPGARTGESTQRSSNYVLYAENTHEVAPQWDVVLGLQGTVAIRKLEDRFLANGDNSVDERYSNVAPKIGVLYRAAPQVDLFANYSGAFEPPTFGELAGGPNITPVSAQKGNSFEVGTRGFLPAVRWDVAYYYTALEDELLSLNGPTGQPLGTVNAPKTTHQGLELGLVVMLGERWVWRSSYLWNDFRFRGNAVYGDNRLPGLPPQFLNSELLYQSGTGWYAGPTIEWSPQSTPVDMANTLFADNYAIWGLKAGLQVAKGFSFFVEGRNLGNKKYVATTGVIADARGLDSAQFLPGDGRSIYAGIEWRL